MKTLTARKERKPLEMGQRPRNLSLDRSQTESDARLPGRETLAPRGQVSKVHGVWKAGRNKFSFNVQVSKCSKCPLNR